jgi:hypothetical protein
MAEAGHIDHDQGQAFTLLPTNILLTGFQFERIDPEAHEQLKAEKEQLEVDVTTLRAQLTMAETQVRRHEPQLLGILFEVRSGNGRTLNNSGKRLSGESPLNPRNDKVN